MDDEEEEEEESCICWGKRREMESFSLLLLLLLLLPFSSHSRRVGDDFGFIVLATKLYGLLWMTLIFFGSWQLAAFGGMGNGRLIVGRGCPFGF